MKIRRFRRDERGIAMVISLLMLLVMSALTTALLTIAQTESLSSRNYRTMTQARFAAESGVHKVVNYLLNTYVPPGTDPGDPLAKYDITKSPVEFGGKPVVLSSVDSVPSNYPNKDVLAAFVQAGQGVLDLNGQPAGFAAYATLISMQSINGQTVASWQIVSDGIVQGTRTATVEVTTMLEKQLTPTVNSTYAVFATSPECNSLHLGMSKVDSYDSTQLVNGAPQFDNGSADADYKQSGHVGTNGSEDDTDHAEVHGHLSSPMVGVGNCSSHNDSESHSEGYSHVHEGVVRLSQEVTNPTPLMPTPEPDATETVALTQASSCPAGNQGKGNGSGNAQSRCTDNGDGSETFAPGSFGNVVLSSSAKLHLKAGTYNFNSLSIDATSKVILDSSPVVVNIHGKNTDGTEMAQPMTTHSPHSTDPVKPYDGGQLKVNYAGKGTIRVDDDITFVGQLNAPKATVVVNSSDYFGSVVGSTVQVGDNARIHLDRNLLNQSSVGVGADMLTSFTWKKY
jgi:hypothetical protein